MKRVSWAFLFIVTMFMFLWMVSAETPTQVNADYTGAFKPVTGIIDGVVNAVKPLAVQILGDTGSSEYFFARFLFFMIIFAIIWVALGYVSFFNENTWALAIVSFAVSVLSSRYMVSDEVIGAVLLPYSALGVTLSAGLPFILYFIVIDVGLKSVGNDYKSIVRKTAWAFFGIVFLFLWLTRIPTLQSGGQMVAWVYPIVAIFAFVMIKADRKIQAGMAKAEVDAQGAANVNEAILNLQGKMATLSGQVAAGMITGKQAAELKKEYQKRIDALLRA